MPPRWLCCLIVMFWLTTTAWLIWRDLQPSWRPGEPPPYRIDDIYEVYKGTPPKTSWTVERGNVDTPHLAYVFGAETWVEYHKEDDTYSLKADFSAKKARVSNHRLSSPKAPPQDQAVYVAKAFKIDLMTSEYRVTRAGRLHSLKADVKAIPDLERLKGKLFSRFSPLFRTPHNPEPGKAPADQSVKLSFSGEVRNNRFFGHCRANAEGLLEPIQFDLPPTTVSHTGSVLMPLHPVNQISGLQPGQRWRQPLVDPLRDAFASLPGFSGGVRFLNAHVLPQPRMLKRRNSETSCLVIEYTDDENETMGSTWVEQSSGRVLRQEAILDDSRWIMTRELLPRLSKDVLDR
ncbi:MAG TPA: hypothetical protein VMG10_18355 [Gemmataceae bacterium]|nr:hypothetical protein [Gemmataceae bacterium]